jgi:hypothetical protein
MGGPGSGRRPSGHVKPTPKSGGKRVRYVTHRGSQTRTSRNPLSFSQYKKGQEQSEKRQKNNARRTGLAKLNSFVSRAKKMGLKGA